jgi:hypothetical protein
MRTQPYTSIDPLDEATFLLACAQDMVKTLKDLVPDEPEPGGITVGLFCILELVLDEVERHVGVAHPNWSPPRAKCVSVAGVEGGA